MVIGLIMLASFHVFTYIISAIIPKDFNLSRAIFIKNLLIFVIILLTRVDLCVILRLLGAAGVATNNRDVSGASRT